MRCTKMQERKYKNTKIQDLERIAIENWHDQAELSLIEQELCFRSSKRSIVLLRATQKRLAERVNQETIAPQSETEQPSFSEFTRRVFGDDRPLRAGWIYFFEAVGQDLFKIGRTRKGPQTRAKASTMCPHDLNLLGAIESVDIVEAEKKVHHHLCNYRLSPKKEWFRAPKDVIMETMEKFQAIYDIALSSKHYRVVEDKYLVLNCKLSRDWVTVKTEKCPFCGRRHTHGAGGREDLAPIRKIEGVSTIGHRVAHCLEAPVELILPDGKRVTNDNGYFLGVNEWEWPTP